MFIAMATGHALYHMIFVNSLAPAGYKAYMLFHPLFNYWIMMVSMMLPMIVLMRYHWEDWHYCAERMLSMLAPVVLLIVLVLAGLISSMILKGSGMALYMIWRRK